MAVHSSIEQLQRIDCDPSTTLEKTITALGSVRDSGDSALKRARLSALHRNASCVGSFLDEAAQELMARATGDTRPIATPWSRLNEPLSGGFWPGLTILNGNPGAGKSQWALQIALAAAAAGVPTLFIGLELDRPQLIARLLGLITNRPWSGLYQCNDPSRAPDRLAAALREGAILRELPLQLEVGNPYGWRGDTLYSRVAAMQAEYGKSPLVVLDYLQIISGEGELRQRIAQAAYQGRAAAREFNAVVLCISSVARQNYNMVALRNGKGDGLIEKDDIPPQIPPSDFIGIGKESGEIEYSADTVLALCREAQQNDRPTRDTWIAIAKQRAGTPQWVRLAFNGYRFGDELPTKGLLI